MYLTELDPKSGLLKIEKEDDGIFAIKEFRDVLYDESLRFIDGKESEELSISCLTAIALTADYKSPIRYYSDNDRPIKAMETVTGSRKAFVWNQEKIQIALNKYSSLQTDLTLEEQRLHYQRKMTKLKELQEAEKYHGTDKKDSNDKAYRHPSTIAKELSAINEDIKKHEQQVQGKDIYENSPVRNGYKLSRLEQKLEDKNSFYHEAR